MPNTNATLTTAQVVEEYGISRRTVGRLIEDYGLRAAQKLPGQTGAYLFRRADVVRALAKKAEAEGSR